VEWYTESLNFKGYNLLNEAKRSYSERSGHYPVRSLFAL